MEKSVAVRLKLVYDQFVKGSKESGKAIADTGEKASGAALKAGDRWSEMGRKTSDLGKSMSTRLTIPIVAAGVAMAQTAISFDNTFQQMRAVAGVADDEVAGLKDSVLDLSRETGRGPKELAEALLAVRSSGLAGAAAMDVLEMAAKGASAGMGDTRELANALTNVIAGYGAANITAAQAMDILTASVQEGKAEAVEMAPQFGRLVPLAAELGIGFGDVAGSLAFMTRSTGDAAQSSTALQGILSKLMKPSQQGEEALEGIGESARSLRDMLDQKGLLGTLVHLRQEMGQESFGLLFDDVQALNGALQLTGPGMKDAQKVIDAVTDSAGKADEAFAKWAESIGAKQSIAWAKFSAGVIEMGDLIAPTAASVMSFLGDMVDVLADLPEPLQKMVVFFGAAVAAAGPLVTVGGNVTKAFSGTSTVLSKVGTAAFGMGAGLGASVGGFVMLAPVVLAAGFALQDYLDTKAEAKRITDDLTEALKLEAAGMEDVADKNLVAELTAGDLGTALRDAGGDIDLLTNAIRTSGDELERLEDLSVHDLEDEVRKLADSGSELGIELERLMDDDRFGKFGTLVDTLDGLSDRFDESKTAAEDYAYGQEEAAEESGKTTEQVELLTQALQDTIDTMHASVDPFFAMQDAMAGVRDADVGWEEANRRVIEAQRELDTVLADGTHTQEQADEAARGLAEAQTGVEEAQWKAAEASVNLVAAGESLRRKLAEQGLSADAARQHVYDWAIQAGFSKDQALLMAGGIDRVTAALDRVPGVTETKLIVKTIYETVQMGSRGGPGFKLHEGGMVAGPRGHEVAGVLLGGEEVLHWDDPRHSANLLSNYGAMSNMVSQEAYGGGGGITNVFNINMAGVISNQSDLDRMVAKSFNRAAASNLVTVRGRPL
jgi:TP901 family phage tail tape measure protein